MRGDGIELRASDVVLIVSVRHIQSAMGIAGQERFAGSSSSSGQRPVVATGIQPTEQVDRRRTAGYLGDSVGNRAVILSARRNYQ